MEFEEKTIKRQEIFDGQIFKVAVDDVELPNQLGTAKRELIFIRERFLLQLLRRIISWSLSSSTARQLKKSLMKFRQENLKSVKMAVKKQLLCVN